MKRTPKIWLAAVAALICSASTAQAGFLLKITEIWPGNEPGENQTGDWFEVTNVGDAPWTSADGTLYFDDDSADPAVADPITGIDAIAPGESVVMLDDDLGTAAISINIWKALWEGPLTTAMKNVPQIGTHQGSGLGGGGDTVTLFLDADGTLTADDIIDSASYVDADSFGGQSWDVLNQQYTALSWGVATAGNDAGNPSLGTPGFQVVIPEPCGLALVGLGLALGSARRRR